MALSLIRGDTVIVSKTGNRNSLLALAFDQKLQKEEK